MDEMIEIRKKALEILRAMSLDLKEVQILCIDIGIVDVCLEYVRGYQPDQESDDLIDLDVFCMSLDILSNVAASNRATLLEIFDLDDLPK